MVTAKDLAELEAQWESDDLGDVVSLPPPVAPPPQPTTTTPPRATTSSRSRNDDISYMKIDAARKRKPSSATDRASAPVATTTASAASGSIKKKKAPSASPPSYMNPTTSSSSKTNNDKKRRSPVKHSPLSPRRREEKVEIQPSAPEKDDTATEYIRLGTFVANDDSSSNDDDDDDDAGEGPILLSQVFLECQLCRDPNCASDDVECVCDPTNNSRRGIKTEVHHHHLVCSDCLRIYINRSLAVGGTYETNLGTVPCPVSGCTQKCRESVVVQHADPILWRDAQARVRHVKNIKEADDLFLGTPSQRSSDSNDETIIMDDTSPSSSSRTTTKTIYNDAQTDICRKIVTVVFPAAAVALALLTYLLPTVRERYIAASVLTTITAPLMARLTGTLIDSNANQVTERGSVPCWEEVLFVGRAPRSRINPGEPAYLSDRGRWKYQRFFILWLFWSVLGAALLLIQWAPSHGPVWCQPMGPCLLLWLGAVYGGGMAWLNCNPLPPPTYRVSHNGEDLQQKRSDHLPWYVIRLLFYCGIVLPAGVYLILLETTDDWIWRGGIIMATFASFWTAAEVYVLMLADEAKPLEWIRAYQCCTLWATGVLVIFFMHQGDQYRVLGMVGGALIISVPCLGMLFCCGVGDAYCNNTSSAHLAEHDEEGGNEILEVDEEEGRGQQLPPPPSAVDHHEEVRSQARSSQR